MATEGRKNGVPWTDHSDVYFDNVRLDENLVYHVDNIQQGKHRHLLSREEQLRDIRRELVRLQAARCAPSSVAKFSSLRPSAKSTPLRRAKTAPTTLATPTAKQTANQGQGQRPEDSSSQQKAAASANPRTRGQNVSFEDSNIPHQRSYPMGLSSAGKRSMTSQHSRAPTGQEVSSDSSDSEDSFDSDSDGSDFTEGDSSRGATPRFYLPKTPTPPPPQKGSQLQARLRVLGLSEVPPHWYSGVELAQDTQVKPMSKTAEYRLKMRERRRRRGGNKRAISAPVLKPRTQLLEPSRVLCGQPAAAASAAASLSRRKLLEMTAPETPPTREMLRMTSHHRLKTAQAQENERLEERVTAFLLSITTKPRPYRWTGHAHSMPLSWPGMHASSPQHYTNRVEDSQTTARASAQSPPALQASSMDKCSQWLTGEQS